MTHNPDDPRYIFYDEAINRMSSILNKNNDLIKRIAECLKQGRVEEATKLAVNHTNHQKFKGDRECI